MAQSNQEKAIAQISGDIAEDLREALPELIESVNGGRSQGSLSISVTLKRHKGGKNRDPWTEVVVDSKTHAPGSPRHYSVEIDNGQLKLKGVIPSED